MTRALRVLAALALAGCAGHPPPHAHPTGHRVGMMTWDCREKLGWGHLRIDFMRDRETGEHEIVHWEQAKRVGCKRWNLGFTALELAELEREAYCEAHRRVVGRVLEGCEGVPQRDPVKVGG